MKLQNGRAIKAALQGIGSTLTEGIPTNVKPEVAAVLDITPDFHRITNVVIDATATNATVANIYTTPTKNSRSKFYLTGAEISVIKDATATSTKSYILLTIDGQLRAICQIASLTLTAQNAQKTIVFRDPVLIDPGVTISVQNSTATGNVTAIGVIYGFTVDDAE